MNEPIALEGLRHRYPWRRKFALSGVDLRVAHGKVTVLLGDNGAGKSTLMRVLLGVLRPTAGTVRVLGHDPLRDHQAALAHVGYVPDTPDVYPWLTPRALYTFLAPHYPTWNQALCAELSAQLAVPLDQRFATLSRGQGMKAMLVAALSPEPEVLLLDEPFAGLDPLVREQVLHGVVQALRDGERTVLCATHELDIAARIADRVAVLHQGRIVRHGDVAEVLRDDEPAPRGLHRVLQEAACGEEVAV